MTEEMNSFSVAIDGLLYKGESSKAWSNGGLSGNPALPRRVVCHCGLSFEVTSLGRGSAPSLFSICVPSSVLQICDDCFFFAPNLCYVAFEFDSRLLDVATRAFQGCPSLKSICIPSRVETIGNLAFFWMLSVIGCDV
jgi:hypothetical protein